MHQLLLVSVLLSLLSCSESLDLQYHVVFEPMSWADAQTHCRLHHTDLASVNDMKDQRNLEADVNGLSNAWIGLHQSEDRKGRRWHWSQPTVRYKPLTAVWAEGEPNDGTGPQNCARVNAAGLWFDQSCDSKYNCHICYEESTNSTVRVQGKANTTSWLEAQRYCRHYHTDLMSGLTQQTQLQKDYPTRSVWCWIGLFRDTWVWSDSSDSSFRNWNSSRSINPQENEKSPKCAALGDQGRWMSADCRLKKNFICEGALKKKTKKTFVKIKISSAVDPNSPVILHQLQEQLRASNLGPVKLTWKKDENQQIFKKQKSSKQKKKRPCDTA